MYKSFLTIGWRNLVRNRTFSLINLIGLSISVAFCLLLFCHIRHEQSFDQFHAKKDRLFRLEMSDMFAGAKKGAKKDDKKLGIIFPLVVSGDMQNSLPDIGSITRLKDYGENLVKVNNRVFREQHLLYTDDNFLQNFSFRLKEGNPATALSSRNSVVLSESTARKYFGNEDPIGKTVAKISDSIQLFTVSGVAEDAPLNSSLQYDWIVPLLSDPDYADNIKERFNHMTHLIFIELKPGVDADGFEAKMNNWMQGYFVQPFVRDYGKYFTDLDFGSYRWSLRPLTDCHYSTSMPWGHYTNARNIYQMACLAIVILLIAALNYVLLSVANVATRAQEAGVRKVLGAGKMAIMLMCWLETQMLVVASVLAAVLLAWGLMPFFNAVLDTGVSIREMPVAEILLALLALALILGILAGFYPAWLLSGMRPVTVMKSSQTFKINPRFSRVLVVLQYSCCVVLMMAAFVINRQMHYISGKDLGFDKEQVVMIKNPVWDFPWTMKVKDRLYAFAQTQPSISAWSGMNGGLNGSYNTNGFRLHGEQQWLFQLTVDYGYFEMLGLKFVDGRPFSRDFPTDTSGSSRACVVNETLFKMLGKDARIGKYDSAIRGTIIGVVKDYHFETLSKKIGPEQHVLPREGYVSNFLFKVRPGMMPQALAALQKEWKVASGGYPFEYTFLDQEVAAMYKADIRWQKIIQASCFFALFIACMGLFGLSAIDAINRTKEIGIRKVLGASVVSLVTAMSSRFLWMVCVAILIAAPLAWWLMSKWLEDFAYRIEISWWMVAIVGFAALAVALGTVSFQVLKAARANPVESLRSE
jgi:putative ABC transport system permease protein